MIKIILFDIDNTLLDHSGAQSHALSRIQKQYFNEIDREEFQTVWLASTKNNWDLYEANKISFLEQQERRIQDVWADFGITINQSKARKLFEEYLAYYEGTWSVFKGMTNLLKSIHIKKGILSNGNRAQQMKKLKQIDVLQYFDSKSIFTSEEIGRFKPDPLLFKHVQNQLGLQGEEILYIGDKLDTDIRPASNAGWKTIWFDVYGLGSAKDWESVSSVEKLKGLINIHDSN